MIILYIMPTILLLAVIVAYWYLPSLMPDTLPFGVRIPPQRRTAPVIQQARRDYQIGLLIIGLLMVVIGWYITSHGSFALANIVEIGGGVLLLALNYYTAHQRIARVKAHENWYQGLQQVVVIDTEVHNSPTPLSWWWILPSVIILLAMLVVAFVRYPALPAQIPTHFGLDGQPNQWSDKTFGVFLLPLFTVLLDGFMLWLAHAITRARHQLDPEHPQEDLQYQLQRNKQLSNLLLYIMAATNVIFLLTQLAVCQVLPSETSPTLGKILIALALIIGVGAIYLSMRQGRQPQGTGKPQGNRVTRDDDRYWVAGMFYNNPDDPAFMVEKRFGIGWTINFGHPQARLASIIFVIVILASLLLPLFNRIL